MGKGMGWMRVLDIIPKMLVNAHDAPDKNKGDMEVTLHSAFGLAVA